MAEQRSDAEASTPLVNEQPDSNNMEPSSSTQRNTDHNSTAQQSQSSSSGDDLATFTPPEESSTPPQPKPTIRFFAYQDPHHPRPSLRFSPMTRVLSDQSSVIQVGRYSERSGPSDSSSEASGAAVGFKSKVVSRKHCEFSISNGQWHIRDVGSSSGTFLNHMRLSPPNTPSRLYVVRDGDIVQLGIDFRGGEEMVYRSVRFRIECNRSWQQRPNEFNKNTENLINSLGKGADADFSGCRECSICLGSVLRPYQCLFMAACAHVWHYKCIRRLIHTQEYPMFQCPNCRAYTDLSAEVDDTNDNDVQTPASRDQPTTSENNQNQQAPTESRETQSSSQQAAAPQPSEDEQLAVAVANLAVNGEGSNSGAPQRSASIAVPNPNNSARNQQCQITADPHVSSPMTPRNDTGLLAFDGRAIRM